MNYLEESDSKEEIYLITWLGKSYNIKNFNNFTKNKNEDNKEVKKNKFKNDDMKIDVRTTRESSRVDKIHIYNVLKDLDNIKPNITFA